MVGYDLGFLFFMFGLMGLPPIFIIVGSWLEKQQENRF
jgi:hypothetical protein